MNNSAYQQPIIALAGIFQAAYAAQNIAHKGSAAPEDMEPLIASVFNFDPESAESVYGGLQQVRSGLQVLNDILKKKRQREYADTVRYAMGLMHLEKQLSKRPEMLGELHDKLVNADQQRVHFDGLMHPSIIAKVADAYSTTLGTLRFRIQVTGQRMHLERSENADRVRAIFLAGVRSAMLWRQLGGRRWDFLLKRRKMLKALEGLNA